MEQTILEFLEEKLQGHLDISRRYWDELLEQAKKIEKDQREKDLESGFHCGRIYQGREGDTSLEQLKEKILNQMESKLERTIREDLKMKETNIKLDTLEKLNELISKQRSNYSRIVIDAVELFKELICSNETTKEEFLRFRYDLDNIIEVIDKTRFQDCDALYLLRVLINSKLETV